MFARASVSEWQRRHASRTCLEDSSGKEMMVAFPPCAATCSFPGPWQPSHPVSAGASFPEATLLKCAFLKNLNHTSGWQALHTLLPT